MIYKSKDFKSTEYILTAKMEERNLHKRSNAKFHMETRNARLQYRQMFGYRYNKMAHNLQICPEKGNLTANIIASSLQ